MEIKRKPAWLKINLPKGNGYKTVKNLTQGSNLHTICESGRCPNIAECWERETATFMILGNICTRACKFCDVKTGKPLPVDANEPMRVANSIKKLKLAHAVITSADRDDLDDKGAYIWAETIKKVKQLNSSLTLEVLIPDFDGISELIQQVIDTKPEVISHNLETVERLTPHIRSRAKYQLSLKVLKQIAQRGIVAKSGLMLGLGETKEEIIQTLDDMRKVGVSVVTIGQYLQPSKKNIPVQAYITPAEFSLYKKIALEKGFTHVESAPFVRSSYFSERHINLKLQSSHPEV